MQAARLTIPVTNMYMCVMPEMLKSILQTIMFCRSFDETDEMQDVFDRQLGVHYVRPMGVGDACPAIDEVLRRIDMGDNILLRLLDGPDSTVEEWFLPLKWRRCDMVPVTAVYPPGLTPKSPYICRHESNHRQKAAMAVEEAIIAVSTQLTSCMEVATPKPWTWRHNIQHQKYDVECIRGSSSVKSHMRNEATPTTHTIEIF